MPRQPGVPAVTTGESEPPRTQFQIEFLGQAEKTSLVEGAPTSSPMSHSKTPSSLLARVPSAKMAPKLSLEHLLQRHTERFSGSGRASQERRWSTMFEDSRTPEAAPLDNCNSSPSWEASTARVPDPHKPGRLTHTTSEHSRVPTEKGVEQGGVQRKQDSPAKDALRMRSRSVSRRSAPVESSPEGPLSRMRSRSAHRERGQHTWEQLKRCTSGEESRDTTTLVREADSQYGTWETGLHTEDSLTPATPTSESTASPSPRKPTPPHTPSELNATAAAVASPQGEAEPLTFPEASTTLLDSSALRSRVQLSKRRSRRTLPSRAARHSATLSMVQEGASDLSRDWMYRDSTEEKAERSKQADSAAEEPLRPTVSCTPSSQPHRAALFPGMDPSALKVQLKKRGDPDNQTDGPTPAPSQLSRSPKSPFLPRASRVLPPAGGKDNEEESSPQWLKELKSKKRFSQYENEA
ncbi:uncharacterized protein KIAA1671-like isoform X2 [Brienomyrus brachyistius]|uniref:uncharacterized protein KIAA1671-like isoform X2 n=1 Tax=Brienomyrus brachyistius TaxID=42636 RepID=UPI0020B213F4|nr:uncharacterized protein KIAA1671-like isoform X2 [Brienomyrus brachyistius]